MTFCEVFLYVVFNHSLFGFWYWYNLWENKYEN